MKRLSIFLFLTLSSLVGTWSQSPKSIVPLADPYILLDGDTYYAYGTHASDGIEYWTSTNLQEWTYGGLALSKANTSEQQWFWAPEIYKMDDRYVMYFSANEHLFVATADSPRGPFIQQGSHMLEALIGDEKCIDSSMFTDDDGTHYLFFVRFTDGNCIWMCRLEDDGITPVANTLKHCLSVSADWEKKMGRVCEGPFVTKHDGLYYLTYSANDYQSQDYGVGYAMTRTLTGTWTKNSTNPILRRRDNLVGTGHHSLFIDKDGRQRIVFHAHDSESSIHPRRMYIGNVDFNGRRMLVTDDTIIRPCSPDLFLKGNIVPSPVKLNYLGDGRYEGSVTLKDNGIMQFVNKNIYFAYNNDDNEAFFKNTHINGGTYDFTVDVRACTWDATAPIDEYKISAFGSSVCNGQGATDFKGYAWLYGQQLEKRYSQHLSDNPFHVSGISIGGNNTKNLLDRFADMTHDASRYVIIGLSLGNEGVHEATDKTAIVNQFTSNLKKLITQIREQGKVPVVMNNYTRGDFTEDDYKAVKQANLKIHQWNVASVNTLGAIDDGTGKWASGFIADNAHPNTAGHREFMYAIPPSLFDALASGKSLPERDLTQSMSLTDGASLRFTPEGTLHPFTISLRFRGNDAGQLLAFKNSTRVNTIAIDADGHIIYGSPSLDTPLTLDATLSDDWHTLTLTHYYARRYTAIYLDDTELRHVQERIAAATDFLIGDTASAVRRDVSELTFWRAALSPEEVKAHCQGKILRSSLELYVPLAAADALYNKAMSTNQLHYTGGTLTAIEDLPSQPSPLRSTFGRFETSKNPQPSKYSLLGHRIAIPTSGLFITQHRKYLIR